MSGGVTPLYKPRTPSFRTVTSRQSSGPLKCSALVVCRRTLTVSKLDHYQHYPKTWRVPSLRMTNKTLRQARTSASHEAFVTSPCRYRFCISALADCPVALGHRLGVYRFLSPRHNSQALPHADYLARVTPRRMERQQNKYQGDRYTRSSVIGNKT